MSGRTPLLLWPFKIIWNFISFIFRLVGRIAGILIGMTCMITGIVLIFTAIGAILGIPLTVFGFLLMVRSIF